MMEVIPKEEEIAVDTMPLATKPPTIIDYKIIKEGKINNYQIIRVNGSSKRYSAFIQMLKSFDREDLETLRIVGIKRLLNVLEVTAVKVRVTASKQNLELFSNLNENYAKKHGWMTFMNGNREVTFKTPYKDQKRNELTSEGHDLLSSRIILSEDDYDRRCERPSYLESMFYKDVNKLGPEYQTRPEESSSRSDVNNQGGVT
ncbi:hypothetical protein Tco_0795687 [Tanacetum coccineum]